MYLDWCIFHVVDSIVCEKCFPFSHNNLAVFSDVMNTTQQLLRSQRDLLLSWTCDHPAPLLRWLHDAEVLSSAQYLALLERSPSNAVAQALETVCATEESSKRFLVVLREVQDYYCRDLQIWVERHCKNVATTKPMVAPVKLKGDNYTQ